MLAARAIVAILIAWALTCSCAGVKRARIMPPGVPGKPYIAEYGRIGSITIFTVNGQYVRENLDEEFTNFGQHHRFRFIPRREFWLDRENVPGEELFFIHHLLMEAQLMQGGLSYDAALERADAAEKVERSRTGLAREGDALLKSGRNTELVDKIHKRLLKEYSAGVAVWIVDGELVRDLFFTDFTEGGHDKVYKYIPDREVWIDDDVLPEERKFILLHELHERRLMSMGWSYSRAHKASSKLEFYCRHHPEESDAMLRNEIERMKISM